MEDYREKFNKLLNKMEKIHLDLYHTISKNKINNYIDELMNRVEIKDKYDFCYYANHIIKVLSGSLDTHTHIFIKNYQLKPCLPIRYTIIDNKIYITKTTEKNKNLLYSELLEINNVPINKIIKEIEYITPSYNKEFLPLSLRINLVDEDLLKCLPSIDNNIETFKLKLKKNSNVIFKKLKISDDEIINKKENYKYEIDDDILTIKYKRCIETKENQMKEFVEKIKKDSIQNNIHKYIVDLRGNSGGNSEIIKPLIEYLKDKEIVTLVDNEVYSSGSLAVIELKKIGSITIGTDIGTTINCFGNITQNEFEEYYLSVTNKFFYYDEDINQMKGINTKEEYKKFKNNQKNNKYFKPQIFKPDYYINNSINEISLGIDKQKELAKKILREN